MDSISLSLPLEQSGASVAAGPVDWNHLDRQTMADTDLAREILAMFMDQSQALLRAVREAGTPRARGDAAHMLKGSARAVGAFGVAYVAGCIESLPADAPDGAVLEAVAQLHAAVAEARSAIASKLSGEARPGL